MSYEINYNKLIVWLLPKNWRMVVHISWLKALIRPVKSLHTKFLQFVANTDFELKISGQVCMLRYGLNTLFDNTLNRFIIQDAPQVQQLYTFQEIENQPVYMPFFMNGTGYDFEVLTPASLITEEVAIRYFLDKHKLPGKRYIIIYV